MIKITISQTCDFHVYYLRVDSLCDGIRWGLKSIRWSSAAADFQTTSPSTGADFGVEEGVRPHKSTPKR